MAPACDARNRFLRCTVLNGVSRGTRISVLRSLSATSAALVIALSENPWIMAERVFMLHGTTIIPAVLTEPLEAGQSISCSEKARVASSVNL